MENKKEIRNISQPVTVDSEKRAVEGYAMLFDTPSDGLHFEEIIERGALDGVLQSSDVFALMNHDERRGILARNNRGKGSLSLCIDERGLKYSFEAPATALGDELLENIRRGEVDASSFAFTVEKDTWEKKSGGDWKRTIHKIARVYDISPVYDAAYSETTVYTRGKENAEKEFIELEKREKAAQLAAYWNNIENQFNF